MQDRAEQVAGQVLDRGRPRPPPALDALRDVGRDGPLEPQERPPDAVRDLVVGGFKTAMGDRIETEAGLIDIAHTGRFVLIDADGGIRGYYGVDEDGLDEIYHRSRHVLAE